MKRRLESSEEASSRLASEGLRPHEQAQLWQRISQSTTSPARARSRSRGLLIVSPMVALAALGLWLQLKAAPPHGHSRHAGQHAQVDPCALDGSAGALSLAALCAATPVQIDGDEWRLEAGAHVTRVPGGARVDRGRVRFSVRPRPLKHDDPAAFRVRVSHGEVRVIGTVFVIEQEAGRGSVAVSEGVIELRWDDGATERVAAGQTLHWPRSVQPPAAVPFAPVMPVMPVSPEAKLAPQPPDAGARGAAAAADLDSVMARLLQLRSQKRFPEAVHLLRTTLSARGLGAVQRERISYELGLALEATGESSCAHWQRHVQRFGSQRYKSALEARLARCQPQ